MLRSFGEVTPDAEDVPSAGRIARIDLSSNSAAPLDAVIAVGGNLTSIPNPLAPHKAVGYVKLATVRLDLRDVAQLTSPVVNPESVGRLLRTHSHTQSAVLPMGGVRVPGRPGDVGAPTPVDGAPVPVDGAPVSESAGAVRSVISSTSRRSSHFTFTAIWYTRHAGSFVPSPVRSGATISVVVVSHANLCPE